MTDATGTISTRNATHYTWGDGCDGWHLVRASGLSVIQERMPDGTAEVRHRHGSARQFFFVLDGTLTIELEGARATVSAGSGLEVAPGRAHQVMNTSGRDVEFLVISQPPAQGDRELAPRIERP